MGYLIQSLRLNVLFRIKLTDASKLQDEYRKLVQGLQEAGDPEDSAMALPGESLGHSCSRQLIAG
jgi:hypothetical protein